MSPSATIEAPSAMPSGGGDFASPSTAGDADLGSALSAAFDSASGMSGEQTETPAAATPETTFQPEDQPTETPGQQPDAAQPGQEAPYPLSTDGQSYLVPKDALPQLQAAQKYHQEVSALFGDAAEAQSASDQASSFRRIMNDVALGTPESVRGILEHLAGSNASDPAFAARCRNGFGQMAMQLPSVLAQANPQAYQQMSQAFAGAAMEMLYQKAAQTGNPADLELAQAVEWGLSGGTNFRQQAATQQDGLTPQQRQFQQQQQQFYQHQKAAYERDVQAFDSTYVEGAKAKALDALIDKNLEPVKTRFAETVYNALRNDIRAEVRAAIKKREDFFQEHAQNYSAIIQDFQHTWQQGKPGAGLQSRIQAYIADYMRQVARELPRIAEPRISGATQARRPQPPAANGTARTSPAGKNGAPQPQSSPNGRATPTDFEREWSNLFAPYR